MEAMEIVNELEEQLNNKQGLFSKKIDIERCNELLDMLKDYVSSDLSEANYIMDKKREILYNADLVAKNTIKEAEDHARHALESHELIRKAEIESDKILDSTYIQSEAIIKKTKDHLDAMFKDVEEFLLSNLTMIRKNRDELRNAILVGDKSR